MSRQHPILGSAGRRIFWILIVAGCIGLFLGAHAATEAPPRALLLHSYAPPMDWVQTITGEIEAGLDADAGTVDLRVEYMDTKRYLDEAHLAQFQDMLVRKYRSTSFDLILCSDNNAYDFLRTQRDSIFPGVPVIFCGVNAFDPADITGLEGFTGVAESYRPRDTVDLMLRLHPGTREIFILNDHLKTGMVVREAIKDDLAGLDHDVRLIHNEDWPLVRLESLLASLQPGQLCLLGTYYADVDGEHSTYGHMGERLAAASAVPMYCLLDFNLTGGPVGGLVTGAQLQGRRAAEMARRFLDGTPLADLPPSLDGAFDWEFHHLALERWDIDRKALPATATVVGRPISLFEEHRRVALITLAIVAFLVLVIVVLSSNILRRRLAEQELRENREDLATTLESIGDGVLATDHLGNIVRLNPAAEALLGWNFAEARGRHLTEVFRLRPSETAPPGHEDDLTFETVLRSGESVTISPGTILVRRDEEEILIADSGAPIRADDGSTRGVVIVFRDVTEQLGLERRLRQAEKMESVGQLAGGIAHDFNNMLAGIMGHAEMLEMELQDDNEKLDGVTSILRASERAADLTRKLLDFSRQGKMLSTPVDLHEIIADTLSLMSRTIGQAVTLETILDAPHATLIGDPTQLQQLVMNLCINARDAMPTGGVVRIMTEICQLDVEACEQSPFDISAGAYVRLRVQDNGTGIPVKARSRIFEPFFTTKERGRGTGLGLAAVYGCVEAHRGAIEVDSAEGRGTTFIIDLPLYEVAVPAPIEAQEPLPVTIQGTVLVVDDDETVRGMAVEMLQGMGHTVLTASDGVEGIEIFGQRRDEIEVVLLDLVMPRLGGRPAFHTLRRIDPQCCVVLCSGFAEPESVRDLLDSGLVAFIAKPYRRVELAETIGQALNQRREMRG